MGLLQNYVEFLKNGGLIPYAAKGLDYLRRSILGDPPSTSPVAPPYTPPFTGGQCAKKYNVAINVNLASGGLLVFNGASQYFDSMTDSQIRSGLQLDGAISNSFTFSQAGSSYQVYYGGIPFGGSQPTYGNTVTSISVAKVLTSDGSSDNCGDIPNPNPAPPIASDGLADSAAPNLLAGAGYIISGTPLADDGAGDLADNAESDFNEAGALSPSSIAGALAKLAEGLAKLARFLQLLDEILKLLKKLFDRNNKSSFSYNFGNLKGDGFCKLYSEPPNPNISGLYLDLQVTTVKTGSSRVLGSKSPNYFYREPIGYIHFVSPTFGVLSSHEIRFIRTSIPIDPLAYGFFYNFGLDEVNRANATGFYLKQEE